MRRRQTKEPESREAVLARLRAWQESRNVAEDFDAHELNNIGSTCVQEYEIDRESRRDWEERVKAALKDLVQEAEPKSYPFENAANIKNPLLTAACLQFAARAYPAIVNSPRPVRTEIVGRQDDQTQGRGDRVAAYMSHQLLHEIPEWDADKDTLLHQIPAVGCAFTKTYWSRERQAPMVKLVSALNLIVNQSASSMETVPRITEHIEFYPHEIDERRRSGFFLDIDPVLSPSDGDSPDGRGTGYDDTQDSLSPHAFLEQHRYLDIDNDGVMEPWIVYIHAGTQQVYRLAPNYDLDAAVFDDNGQLVRLPRYHYYVKYSFIPDPRGGFYDIGFGELLASLNDTLDSSFNQMLDAGHLQNAGGGFIGSGLNLKKTEFRFVPGKYHNVAMPGQAIRDAIVPLQHPGPSPVMMQLLQFLLEWGKQITSVQDVLSGDAVPHNQPATTTLAQIEQGLKVFTAIYKRVYRALTQEFRLLYQINSRYPDDAQYARVLGFAPPDSPPRSALPQAPAPAALPAPGAPQPGQPMLQGPQPQGQPQIPPPPPPPSMEADFASSDCRVVPQADPQMVTDMQRMMRAQALTELCAHPVLGPQLDPQQIVRRVVTNLGIENTSELIVQPNPQVQQRAQLTQEMQLRELTAKVDKLEAETQLILAKVRGEHAGIVEAGHGMMVAAGEQQLKAAHAAHEAEQAITGMNRDERQAQHDQHMDLLEHAAGRQDAARQHVVDLMGLAQQPGPDETQASAQTGGARMAPAVLNRVAELS